MTRFARRGKEQKKTEDPTKWNEMFNKSNSDNFRNKNNDGIKKNYREGKYNNNNNKRFENNVEKLSSLVDENVREDLVKLRNESTCILLSLNQTCNV